MQNGLGKGICGWYEGMPRMHTLLNPKTNESRYVRSFLPKVTVNLEMLPFTFDL
jgi:hypothetical protein